jgi:hypothetical protein
MRFTINFFNSENSPKIELIIGVENHKRDFPWCDFYQIPPTPSFLIFFSNLCVQCLPIYVCNV